MSTDAITTAPQINEQRLQKHNVTLSRIQTIKDHSLTLKVEGVKDHAGLRKVVKTRKFIKKLRLNVENRRKELNADILREMRENNYAARFIINELKPSEKYLNGIEKEIANEKERIKLEKKRQALERLQKRIEQLNAFEVAYDLEEVEKATDAEFSLMIDKAKFTYTAAQEQKRIEAKRLADENERLRQENERLKQSIPAVPKETVYEPVNDEASNVLPLSDNSQQAEQLNDDEKAEIKKVIKNYASALMEVPLPEIKDQQSKSVFLSAHSHIATGINMLLKAVE